MLRALLLLLLLANGLLLGVRQGWFATGLGPDPAVQREPQRLDRQVSPGLITVQPAPASGVAAGSLPGGGSGAGDPAASAAGLPPPSSPAAGTAASAVGAIASGAAAGQASAASPAPAPAASVAAGGAGGGAPGATSPAVSTPVAVAATWPPAGAAASAPPIAPASAALAPRPIGACVETGPLAASESGPAEQLLQQQQAANGLRWQALRSDGQPFMIYMGRYEDEATLLRKIDELRRRRVDAAVMPPGSPMAPGLDLGRHDTASLADAALARLNTQGVRTARVVAIQPTPTVVLRVPEADAALRARLVALGLPSGRGFRPCARR